MIIRDNFPPQKLCKASNNQIEVLPDTISIFWKTHLREVDFSENVLKELPSYIFELEVRSTPAYSSTSVNQATCFSVNNILTEKHFEPLFFPPDLSGHCTLSFFLMPIVLNDLNPIVLINFITVIRQICFFILILIRLNK